ncbi:MAG: O-antigen ligase family protein [Chloroflexi bacterium]|nr:O-antigen ligase family protein [Chloroflexota bacterium]
MKSFINSRWFALADLALVALGGFLWFNYPELSWQPLLLVLAPWFIRLLYGKFPFQRTPLDLFIFIFLITAVISLYAAFNPLLAWQKWWLLLSSVFLFYTVAGQPKENHVVMGMILSLGGGVTAVYFFSTQDWQQYPAGLGILNEVGMVWMGIRPTIPGTVMHPNVAASLMAMSFPFVVAMLLYFWRRGKGAAVFLMGMMGLLTLTGFLLTGSRGAWLALAVGLGLWGLWVVSHSLSQIILQRQSLIFGLLVGSISVAAILLIVTQTGNLMRLIGSGSRPELMQNSLYLLADYPLTGSGLATFSAVYSQYILIIPFKFIGHGHNLFLNVAVEQGIIGVLSLLGIIGGAVWLLLRQITRFKGQADLVTWLQWATLSSLMVWVVHGLVDDALYGQRGSPLLFLLAGTAVMITQIQPDTGRQFKRTRVGLAVALLLGMLGGLLLYRQTIMAQWYANQGALEMARVELADWPLNEWDDGRNAAALEPAKTILQRGLSYQENQTAHYRLGLVAMLERDYDTAVTHLKTAHQINPNHPGIIKALGYSYLWTDDLENAELLLTQVPGTVPELNAYEWWWGVHGRDDLSRSAVKLRDLLQTDPDGS